MNTVSPGFSRDIDVRRVERRSRGLLGTGYAFAALMLAILAIVWHAPPRVVWTVAEKPDRIMHFDIIERPVVTPLPPMVQTRSFTPRVLSSQGLLSRSIPAPPSAGSPGKPGRPGPGVPGLMRDIPYAYSPGSIPVPEWKANIDSPYRMPKGIASGAPGRSGARDQLLQDEMLKPEDFEWAKEGEKTGMVVYNPKNRLALKGIVPIPILFSSQDTLCLSPGITELVHGIQAYTDLTIGRRVSCHLSERTYFEFPFLYISINKGWDYLPMEAILIGEYLLHGGFILFDNDTPRDMWNANGTPGEWTIRHLIRDGLGSRYRFQVLPPDHALYTCFFEYPEGPPPGADAGPLNRSGLGNPPEMEGLMIGNRLAAVLVTANYGRKWADAGTNIQGGPLRMGVNYVVYALRQEGGNAVKRYDYAMKPGIQTQRNIAGLELFPEKKSE